MNSTEELLISALRKSIAACGTDDGTRLGRELNGLLDDQAFFGQQAAIDLLKIAAAEGIVPLLKSLTGQQNIHAQLESIATGLAIKRHLAQRSATHAVRTWAAALGMLPSPVADRPVAASPAVEFATSTRPPLYLRIRTAIIAIVAIVTIGLAIYYRHQIWSGLEPLLFVVGILWGTYAVMDVLMSVLAWAFRKLFDGLKQIKQGLDWVPGWVYVVVITTLGISDWLGALPWGMRDVAAFVQEAERSESIQPAGDDNQGKPMPVKKNARPLPTSPVIDALELPPLEPVRRRVMPVAATPSATHVQQTASASGKSVRKVPRANPELCLPTPTASETANLEKQSPVPPSASAFGRHTSLAPMLNTEARSTHILEFHLPQHGNDPLHVTVQGDIHVGTVVAATFRGRKLRLQVLRPLANANGYEDTQRWLAVPVPERRETMVGATP